MPALTLATLQAHLGGHILGDPARILRGAASLERAGPEQLSFVVGRKFLTQARASAAGALLVAEDLAAELEGDRLVLANPHAGFARALTLLHPPSLPAPGIHPAAVVSPQARIGAEVHIGPCAVVEAGAVIGRGCILGAHSYVGPEVQLGEDCLLHPRSTVLHGCRLGHRVILHPGCVIGGDGFGLAWEGDHWLKVPQVGRVILGDDVEVGANATIDRGALDDTVLEEGVKIDNLVQVAHNCHIGRQTAIAGCAGIAGSVKIGAHCQIAGAAMISGHLEIGDRVTISGGSLVAKDIPAAGVYTSVMPLMPYADWRRNAAHLRHLDDLARRIKALEKQPQSKE
ncbi:MAG TPA: UDP-3-O-(3-hydroxymyristoyl)glucosamine N-acyltransferase [Thiobacillaceae bacterium]|nr:UDP-3-O-(3-hydroxymyristoyl)glucosamine N-acyltransferase [Thiobacillaceae bacterium]HNU63484.1 UDP-3-O-(3-hydroxymyristoyl)glucosamine N-acyltransferase [Thiobacillaceae bacterium]